MTIYFVRHGHPNYAKDCLTELGISQAEASAEIIKSENISKFYASTCGRAFETAQIAAKKSGQEVIPLEFMRELRWGPKDDNSFVYNGGHPWESAEEIVKEEDFNIRTDDWKSHKYFKDNVVVEHVEKVQEGFEGLLSEYGYRFLEDGRIFCERESKESIAIYSHGGSGASVYAKLFNVSFPYACLTFAMNFTSITIVDIPSREGSIVLPRLRRVNDDRHVNISNITFQM